MVQYDFVVYGFVLYRTQNTKLGLLGRVSGRWTFLLLAAQTFHKLQTSVDIGGGHHIPLPLVCIISQQEFP